MTVKGLTKIQIKAGTKDGTKKVLKGYGMKKVTNKGSTGDHIVTLRIDVPTNLSDK